MPRRLDPEKLREENRELKAENRRLRHAAGRIQKRVEAMTDQVETMRLRQASLAATSRSSEDLLRWLRARVEALEREMKG